MTQLYMKSEKGIREFEPHIRTLSLKQRQLLIMVDGVRTSEDLIKLFRNVDAKQMLQDMATLGYIVDNHTGKNPIKEIEPSPKEVLDTLSSAHLDAIKSFLLSELELQAGIMMNRELVDKINRITNSSDLKPNIARWHMAIRDSKNGRKIADELMGKLHHIIANPPTVRMMETKMTPIRSKITFTDERALVA